MAVAEKAECKFRAVIFGTVIARYDVNLASNQYR
jgi:hypothetical protein